ncbi:MAG: hypothetical protein R3B47_03725 [Bacteroidia bacterium]
METISFEAIEKAWDDFFQDDEDVISKRMTGMSEEQPLIMVYLMSVGEEILDEYEQESLFANGAFVWFVLKEHGCDQEVTEAMLDEVEGKHAELLEDLEALPPEEYVKHMNTVLASHNQHELLNFMLDVLEEEVEAEDTDDENAGMMFTVLQVIVDCLLEAKAQAQA